MDGRQGVRFDDLVQADRVHPVSQGYRIMAEAVMQLSSCDVLGIALIEFLR